MKSEKDFYERIVRDTLDSIVSSGVRDSVLAAALTLAGEIHVPRRAREFRAFVRGALRETLERALGQELGSSVVAELIRLSEAAPASSAPPRAQGAKRGSRSSSSAAPRRVAESHPDTVSTVPPAPVRAQRVGNAPTVPARPRRNEVNEAPESTRPRSPISNDYPAGVARAFGMLSSNPAAAPGRKLPIVFVATRDAELVRRFSAWLDPRASVVRVMRLAELLVHVQDAGDRRMVIVVDGSGSPVRLEALAAVSEEVPETLSVILWGATREVTARLSELFPRVSEWLVCSDHMPLSDVIDRCAELVG